MVVKKSVFRPWEMNKWIEDTASELIRKYTKYGFKMDYVLKSKWRRNHCQYRVSSKRKFLHSRIKKKLSMAKNTRDYFRSHFKFFAVCFFPISPENKLTCERYFLFLLRFFFWSAWMFCTLSFQNYFHFIGQLTIQRYTAWEIAKLTRLITSKLIN